MSEGHDDNPLQGYFEWQVTTIMLALDIANPLERGDQQGAMQRRAFVEQEVSNMTLDLIPQVYLDDPSLAWPAEVMVSITKATLARASEVIADGEAL